MGSVTRALSYDDGTKTLNALWAEGELVTVYTAAENSDGVYVQGQSQICTLQATNVSNDGMSCTLTGDIDPTDLSQGQKLYLQYRGGDKTGTVAPDQDGTLQTIADFYDRAYAVVTIQSIGDATVTTDDATFANRQAIVRFTLQDKSGNAVTPSSVTIEQTVGDAATSNTLSGSAFDAAYSTGGCFYYAFSQNTATGYNGDIEITATDADGDTYSYTKEDVTFTAGKFYSITVKMEIDNKKTPLTMEAITGGTIMVNKPKEGMKYTINGGTKTAVTSEAIPVQAGDKVQFYGDGTDITSYKGTEIAGGTATVKVYGNIMSLVDEEDFAKANTVTENAFFALFYRNYKLTDASSLLLPAETLASSCYRQLFQYCTSLTAAPALDAVDLASECYRRMFYGCTSLTTAPELPVDGLATGCYREMFYGCTSLYPAPELPAEDVAKYCYYQMFYGCTSLTEAPLLPAETLTDYCYYEMFCGCTSLSYMNCLAVDHTATGCTQNWLKNVASSGVIVLSTYGQQWDNSDSGCPIGWRLIKATGSD